MVHQRNRKPIKSGPNWRTKGIIFARKKKPKPCELQVVPKIDLPTDPEKDEVNSVGGKI